MAARLTFVYFCMILFTTFAGYEFGEYLRSAEDTFNSHQQQLYYGTFPKLSSQQKQPAREMQKLRLQLLSIATCAGGFLLGVLLVSRTDANLTAQISAEAIKSISYKNKETPAH